MDEMTRIILTRAFQIIMCIPVIMGFRQLYKDFYDNESDTHQDPESD
jgi:hypothetical protein